MRSAVSGLKSSGPRRQRRASSIALLAAIAVLFGCDGTQPDDRERLAAMGLGDPEQGRLAIQQYACVTCHRIPEIVGPDARIGPPLAGIADRKYIAGVLPNTPENMVRWIQAPKEIDPLTAMPDMDVSEPHARDMVAYLYTLSGSRGLLD